MGTSEVELPPEPPTSEAELPIPLRIAFAGGKGGTGRSLLAANLAVYLSRRGRSVVLADLDPGGASLHTYLGLEPLIPSLAAMVRPPEQPAFERVSNMNLWLYRPSRLTETAGDPSLRTAVLKAALERPVDVAILDLGVQADDLTVDCYLDADVGINVVLPEPVAMERMYGFLRVALYRWLLHGDHDVAIVARAVLAADQVGQFTSPIDLATALTGAHPEAAKALRARLAAFNPRIVVNKCHGGSDFDMLHGIVSALKRRWRIDAVPAGAFEHDDTAWHASRARRPLLLEYPGSSLGRRIEKLARTLLASSGRRDAGG